MSGINIDLFDKYGERVTYAVLANHKHGDDITIGGCVFKLDSDGKYKTKQDPLLMFEKLRGIKNERR